MEQIDIANLKALLKDSPGQAGGGARVSSYPPQKYLLAGCKAGCETANYERSQSDKYANPADVWHLGDEGEKPKVRQAIVPQGFVVCVAQHGWNISTTHY